MPNLDDLRNELLRTHLDFKRLHDEHRQCEQRLAELGTRTLLGPEDEVEEKRLKIHKLALKDQMETILREQGTGAPV